MPTLITKFDLRYVHAKRGIVCILSVFSWKKTFTNCEL